MKADIFYQITPFNVHAHLFEVKLTIKKPNVKGQLLSLPNWISGSYLIRNFAKHIVNINAKSKQGSVNIVMIDKNHWQVEPVRSQLEVTYQIYSFEQSVRSAFLSIERGFFNGSNVLLAVEGQLKTLCFLEVCPLENWQIATGLIPYKKTKYSTIYQANHYEDLIDHPVEMSDLTQAKFKVNNIAHHIAISGKYQTHHPRLVKDVAKICQYHQNFFGDIPFDNYLFLLLVTKDNYGGLEHKNSSSLICARTDLLNPYIDNITPEYTRLLGLFSHEYIHAWWIKRLKPKNFHQLDFNKEVYTEQLWIFEGWTSYYDELSLLRVKLLTPEQYLSLFAQTISRVISGSARHKQSLLESSFSAWSKFYQQDENAPNAVVSYYTKGALVAFMLDVKIRKASNNQHSLDDAVRLLWQQYQQTGLEDNTAQQVIEQLIKVDLSDFFNRFVSGVAELPLAEYFDYLGINYQTSHTNKADKKPLMSFNCDYEQNIPTIIVVKVYDHTSVQTAGLYVGDEIIAINGVQVSPKTLNKTLNQYRADSVVKLSLFREGILTHLEVNIEQKTSNIASLTLQKKLSKTKQNTQDCWFYGIE